MGDMPSPPTPNPTIELKYAPSQIGDFANLLLSSLNKSHAFVADLQHWENHISATGMS
jgi:hypothetical protein